MKYSFLFFTILLMASFSACTQKSPAENAPAPKKYSIDQFYKSNQIGGGSFSNDETKLLIHSNETGIYNLFEIDLKDGSKKQLTSSVKESFFSQGYVPGTNEILYVADKGGNEMTHLYLLDADGTSTDLTAGENEKVSSGYWSKDKSHLYYGSNKRNPQFFDQYKMKIGDWEPTMIYQNDDGLNLTDMSNDENLFALQKSITTSAEELFIFDKKADKTIEISNPEKTGSYNSAGFSDDGKYLYYISNGGEEFAYLAEYDIANNTHKTLFKTDWDVQYSYLSENEKYRVIGINEDGKNNLVIQDNKTGEEVDFPAIPDGDITAVNISNSEENMRITVGNSKGPSNIYLYNFATKELKKLTETLNPDINPKDLVSAKVVRFSSFDDLEIPAIYYKPLTASATNKVPAVIWVHGGPGGQSRTGYFPLLQYLVNNGYAVLAVNNRGSSGYGKTFNQADDLNHGDKDLQDIIYGKKWLQGQDYIDGENIGIIGGSYGGFMTMAAMSFAPDEFAAGVNIFGVTNWLRTLKSIPPYWESFREALYKEMGDPFTADSVRLYNISPVFHGNKVKNPVMILQGANDVRVLQVESDEMVAAIRENGVPVEYVLFPDEGHGFRKKENEIEGYGQILTFLDKYLRDVEVVE